MLSLEAHVDGATTNLPQQRKLEHYLTSNDSLLSLTLSGYIFSTAEYGPKIESCLKNLLEALGEVVDTFKKALYFLLVRVSHTYLPANYTFMYEVYQCNCILFFFYRRVSVL